MKSTFFHIGVNRSNASRYRTSEPVVNPDGSIPYVPLPDHLDPDFQNLTYGDPSGRLRRLNKHDIAWFIESGTLSVVDWGYFLVAYFVIEDVYHKEAGIWDKKPAESQVSRIRSNAHEAGREADYDIILGEPNISKLSFLSPLRISFGEDAVGEVRRVLGLSVKPTKGYWFKRWFDEPATKGLLEKLSIG